MLCLGRAWGWQALLCSALLRWSSYKQWSRNVFGQEQKGTYAVKTNGCQKNTSLNRICWLNTNSDIFKSKVTEVVNWIDLFFFLPGIAQWMKIQLISSLSVIITRCSSFHLWMRSPYFTLTTLLSIDLLLLNPVLNAMKFAQRMHVAASTEHWATFSWPSLWKCSFSLFKKRGSSGNSKKYLCKQKRNGKKGRIL